MIFEQFHEHLDAMLGSSFIANVLLTANGARGVITYANGSQEVTT